MVSPSSRPPTTTTTATTGARLRMMMTMVWAASAVLLTMEGNNAQSTPTPTTPFPEEELAVDESTASTIRTLSDRESVEFATLKRLMAPDKSPRDWRKVRDPRRHVRV